MKYGSCCDRSWIQRTHGAPRISTDDSSTQYSEMNTGIWITTGRQPPNGLTFSVLYNSISAEFIFWGSPLKRSRRACIRGVIAFIRAMDL